MSTIKLLLERQAAQIKLNAAKLKEAAELEKKAAELRQQATRPAIITAKDIRAAKEARLERFGNAFAKNKANLAEKALTGAGWKKQSSKWVNPDRPGFSLEIKNEQFTVYYNDQAYLENSPLQYLNQFLSRPLAVTQKP